MNAEKPKGSEQVPQVPGFVTVKIDGKFWAIEKDEYAKLISSGKLPTALAHQ